MINRIRDIRRQKNMTLADVALACDPPTTAQTIGRLEAGMRNLSLVWMNRIAATLQVEPETLLRSEGAEPARLVATLGTKGAEALKKPALLRQSVDVDPAVSDRAAFAETFGNLSWRTTAHIAEQAEFGVHFAQRRLSIAEWLQAIRWHDFQIHNQE